MKHALIAFTEELEIQITMGRPCLMKFYDEQGRRILMTSRITKLYKEHGNCIVLVDNKLRIPADKMIEVNRVPFVSNV